MTSNNLDDPLMRDVTPAEWEAVSEATASAQLLDGDTVVVDRVAWERLNPAPTPDLLEGKFAYFGGEVESDGKRVWTGRRWESVAVAEQHALDILWAVAWARQEAQS